MKKLLFIDDEPDLRNIFRMFVSSIEGVTFLEAEDGKIGLEIANRELPDLIIIDYKMPFVSGIDVIKQLKKSLKTAHIPTIMYTGYASEIDANELDKIGCNELLSKPVLPEVWKDIIIKYIFK